MDFSEYIDCKFKAALTLGIPVIAIATAFGIAHGVAQWKIDKYNEQCIGQLSENLSDVYGKKVMAQSFSISESPEGERKLWFECKEGEKDVFLSFNLSEEQNARILAVLKNFNENMLQKKISDANESLPKDVKTDKKEAKIILDEFYGVLNKIVNDSKENLILSVPHLDDNEDVPLERYLNF